MSRLKCWGLLTGVGAVMWMFGAASLDTFTACAWFGGLSLFVHWMTRDV